MISVDSMIDEYYRKAMISQEVHNVFCEKLEDEAKIENARKSFEMYEALFNLMCDIRDANESFQY